MRITIILKAIFLSVAILIALNIKAETHEQIHIQRFDKDFLEYIKSPSESTTKTILSKYPSLLPALAQTISPESEDKSPLPALRKYFSNISLRNIYQNVIDKYSDLNMYEKELSDMVVIARKELNILSIPQFAVHISGFKENTIYVNNTISLSLDKYMGTSYSGYRGYFKTYQLQQMQSKYITRDFVKAWLMADFIKTENTNGDLLSEMVEQGKLLYALSILLPDYNEQDLIGYTEQEYTWCKINHKKIWNNIVSQNHLYSTDRHILNPYFDARPNTQNGIKNTSGQIGNWIGYQIIKQYVNTTKNDLRAILNADAKIILKDAKYRPKSSLLY